MDQRRRMQQKSTVIGSDGGTTSASPDQNQQTRTSGQQILQSLASHSSSLNSTNANERPPRQLPSPADMAGLMSQVLQTPALNGLLAGVSEQTGVGSPDVLRNMLQQLSVSPQMRNAVNQIVQQVDSQDIESMFSGLGRGGQGGGLDLPRIFQQMMPMVSQALGGGSTPSQLFPALEAESQSQYNDRLSRDNKQDEETFQVYMGTVSQRNCICFLLLFNIF